MSLEVTRVSKENRLVVAKGKEVREERNLAEANYYI